MPSRRRGHNEGSIFQRSDNGKWRAQVSLPNGDRIGKTFDSQREARRWLTRTLKMKDDGIVLNPEKMTLERFLTRWLADVVAHSRRPQTYNTYASLVNHHIIPALGDVYLSQLRADMIQQFLVARLHVLSPSSTRLIYCILHSAFDQAVQWGLMLRNVCDAVRPPRVKRQEMRTLTAEQVVTLLDTSRDTRWYPLWLLAVSTGMRHGEMLALRWPDVDLDGKRLRVTATMTRNGKLAEPKSERALRTIMLSDTLVAALREHRRAQLETKMTKGHDWNADGFVFANSQGVPWYQGTVRDAFKAALRRANLPPIRLHDLRHTCATLLLANGTHAKAVQEILGHSSIAMTLDLYAHMVPATHEAAAASMDRLLSQ